MRYYINDYLIKEKVSPSELDLLLAEGWRHFGNQFFRYSMNMYNNMVCKVIPLRINLAEFTFSGSQKKILSKNKDLRVEIKPLEIDEAKLELFEKHKEKFTDNVPPSLYSFLPADPADMPCDTLEINVYDGEKLVASSFMDRGEEATSSIYGMYDLDYSSRSLGIYTMLLEIKYAQENGRFYYYHGYCYSTPSFYDYKKRFNALECYDWKGKWLKFNE